MLKGIERFWQLTEDTLGGQNLDVNSYFPAEMFSFYFTTSLKIINKWSIKISTKIRAKPLTFQPRLAF